MTYLRQPPMGREEVDSLAVDLAAELSDAVGEPDRVRGVLTAWLDSHDVDRLALVALAVIRDVFTTYLVRVTADDVPSGALVLTERSHP